MSTKTLNWGEDDGRGPVFRAKFDGHCEGCGEDFDEGDEVFYLNGDLFANHDCGFVDALQVCPNCFQTLSKSGACGC